MHHCNFYCHILPKTSYICFIYPYVTNHLSIYIPNLAFFSSTTIHQVPFINVFSFSTLYQISFIVYFLSTKFDKILFFFFIDFFKLILLYQLLSITLIYQIVNLKREKYLSFSYESQKLKDTQWAKIIMSENADFPIFPIFNIAKPCLTS